MFCVYGALDGDCSAMLPQQMLICSLETGSSNFQLIQSFYLIQCVGLYTELTPIVY